MVWQTLQHYFKMFDLDFFFFFLSKFDVYKIKVIEQFCMRLCWRYETIYRKLHGELPVGKQSVFLALPLRQDKLWLVRKLSISHYLTYLTTKTKLLIIKITDQKKKKISRPVSICGKRNRTNIPGWQTSTSQVLPDAHFCILWYFRFPPSAAS